MEERINSSAQGVFIVKNLKSELTFNILLQYFNVSALHGLDFIIAGGEKYAIKFSPLETRIQVDFSIISDSIPEGDAETFVLEISNDGNVPFGAGITSTTIVIVDNDG